MPLACEGSLVSQSCEGSLFSRFEEFLGQLAWMVCTIACLLGCETLALDGYLFLVGLEMHGKHDVVA